MAEKFDQSVFAESLGRLARGQDHGAENPHPAFDPALHRDVVDDAVRGRRIDDFRQALERGGFAYFPPADLPAWNDGRARKEGEWRNARLKLAFTTDEVLSRFPNGPEELWRYVQEQRLRARIQATARR